jgi:hypothetical protein
MKCLCPQVQWTVFSIIAKITLQIATLATDGHGRLHLRLNNANREGSAIMAARNKVWLGMPRRFETKVMAALVFVPVVLTQTPARAYDLPYDPYPWCAQYSGDGGGGSNCGFLTFEQCRADVSGIGGFCVHNQFYNPGYASAGRVKKKRRY